jgi:hypothetical protein
VVKFIGFRPKRRLKKIPKVKYRDNRISKEEQEQPAKVVVIQEDEEEEDAVRVVSPIYAPSIDALEKEETAEEEEETKEPETKEKVIIKEEKPKKRKYTRRKKKTKATEVSEPKPSILPLELSEL